MLLLPAALTLADAVDAQRLLGQSLLRDTDPGDVVVDATHLRQFDSSALAVLLECRRLAAARGKGLSVRGAPAQLVVLARLCGIDAVVPFDQSSP